MILKHVFRNLKGARKLPVRGQHNYSAMTNIVSGVKLSENIPPPAKKIKVGHAFFSGNVYIMSKFSSFSILKDLFP